MNEINITIDPAVFNDVYLPLLDDMAPMQIIFGGSSSGKSVFVAQRTVFDILAGGRNYLVVRKVGKYLRKSVFEEINKIIKDWNLSELFTVNKTEMTITCENGYQILFAGLEDVQRLKSITPAKGVLTDIWAEEATELEPDDLKQLKKRLRGIDLHAKDEKPKRITLTFNPILKSHHIYVEYFSKINWAEGQREFRSPELSITKTWYIHNRFLTSQDVEELLNEADEYYRQVYTFGNWGVLGNVIFKNWKVVDLLARVNEDGKPNEYYLPENQRTNRLHGLDFGFSDDPAAVPATHYDKKHKTIYLYAELYESGLLNDALATEVIKLIGNDYVTADSAEPKSIAELQRYGVNVKSAKKGKDSVEFGIQWLQQHTIVIHVGCINARNEFEQYHWKKDKQGSVMRVPVDKNNNIIDAMRYAYEDEMLASQLNWEGAGAEKVDNFENRWK